MTSKEIKQKIAESPNKDWYQNYEMRINYPHLIQNFAVKGVANIYEFILKVISEYDKYESLPPEITRSKTWFSQAKQIVITLLVGEDTSKGQWDNQLTVITKQTPILFLPEAPETQFLIKTYNEKQAYYPGAYEFISGNTQHVNSKNHFIGYLLAYEFNSKEFSQIVERKEAEKKTISKIRSDFEKALSEAENHLVEHIALTNQKSIHYASTIDEFKKQREDEFYSWYDSATKAFVEFDESSRLKTSELETLYHEKLKLEAPAQYWQKRAVKLRGEGKWWLASLILSAGVGIAVLIWVLSEIAKGTLEKIFSSTDTAIKWSIALVMLISFLAYIIRTFSKLTFSAFHLVRDAEEREQLAYVYLALKKEESIDKTERHLIMQSLFSRADSGLLKDESSPTMPGNIVDKMMAK